MAWLQNLAGRAEDLLNKIDQNAATVLNESISISNLETETVVPQRLDTSITIVPNEDNVTAPTQQSSFHSSPYKETNNDGKYEDVGMNNSPSNQAKTNNDDPNENVDGPLHSSRSEGDMSSSSAQNSFVLAEESHILNVKLAKLEVENQDLQKQLLNLKHLYSEIKNQNANLHIQLERANEEIAEAHSEKEQYKARAQRILQEKEKSLMVKNEVKGGFENDNTAIKYNEQLKQELEKLHVQNEELVQRNNQLVKEIQSLQIQQHTIQNDLHTTIDKLEQQLSKEKKIKMIAEEECSQKNYEIHMKAQEIMQLQEQLNLKINENIQLKESIKLKNNTSGDFESTIKNLTQTLMLKQNHLETVTTERNALKLQLEKLENEYNKAVTQLRRSKDKVVRVEDIDDPVSMPHVLRVSPFDVGVTRRVKHAYSTLDAISIRTGIFLRRYPLARVFVFTYMIFLHIWVLMILFYHAPVNQ